MKKNKGATAPAQDEKHTPIAPMDFTDGVLTFRYDFSRVSVEGVETAVALLELHAMRQQKGGAADSLQLRKSGAHEWQTETLAYVLREVDNGKILPYDVDRAADAHSLLKKLEGVENYLKVKECITDFFTGIGHGKTVSMLLQKPSSLNINEVLSTVLTNAMRQPNNAELSSNASSA